MDGRQIHAADEADDAGFTLGRRHGADQEGALFSLEQDRLHIRLVQLGIQQGELGLRELIDHPLQGIELFAADYDDRRIAGTGQLAQGRQPFGLAGR